MLQGGGSDACAIPDSVGHTKVGGGRLLAFAPTAGVSPEVERGAGEETPTGQRDRPGIETASREAWPSLMTGIAPAYVDERVGAALDSVNELLPRPQRRPVQGWLKSAAEVVGYGSLLKS